MRLLDKELKIAHRTYNLVKNKRNRSRGDKERLIYLGGVISGLKRSIYLLEEIN